MNYSAAVTVSVAGILVGVLTGCSGMEPVPHASSATSTPQDEGRSVANYFKVGDCLQEPVTGAKSVTIVDCANPHAGEVYAIFTLPDGPFPGNGIGSEYKKKCGEAARAYGSPAEANDPSLRTNIRFPDENSWAQGDRSVTCIATSNPPRTGSIRNTQ